MAVEVSIDVAGANEFQKALTQFDLGMQRQVHERLGQWAEEVKTVARGHAPVKTGHLRDSIYAKMGEWVADIGAEATYAMFVELGTRYMKARPFLYPAVQEALPRLETIIGEAIEAAKREAGL
jgi:HK97 gp10 family phage protein